MTIANPDTQASADKFSLTGLLGSLSNAASTNIAALGQSAALNRQAQASQVTAKAKATTANAFAKALPWIVGGVLLLLVLFFVFKRR